MSRSRKGRGRCGPKSRSRRRSFRCGARPSLRPVTSFIAEGFAQAARGASDRVRGDRGDGRGETCRADPPRRRRARRPARDARSDAGPPPLRPACHPRALRCGRRGRLAAARSWSPMPRLRGRNFPAYRANPVAETLKAIEAIAADAAFAAAYANFRRDMVYGESARVRCGGRDAQDAGAASAVVASSNAGNRNNIHGLFPPRRLCRYPGVSPGPNGGHHVAWADPTPSPVSRARRRRRCGRFVFRPHKRALRRGGRHGKPKRRQAPG